MAKKRIKLTTPRDVRRASNRIANMLLNMELEAKTANAVLYACNVALAGYKVDVQDKRLDELEELVEVLTRGRE